MSSKTLMLFIDDEQHDSETVDIIISFFKKSYDDIGIITDSNKAIPSKYATIPSIHLRFFQGDIIFLSLSSYLEYSDILAKNIFVRTTTDEIISNNITRARIGRAKIISINDCMVEVTEYATV